MIYVMSDIHGNLERFQSIMKQIDLQPEDTLYILGDVIDRYPSGIKILRQLMKMPNVKMLLGNHEYMMLNAIGHCADAAEEKKWAGGYPMRLWYHNGGEVTHNYLKHLRKSQRAEIFAYLRQLRYNIDAEVDGVKYKLVHASPKENYETEHSHIYEYENAEHFAVWNRWRVGDPVPKGYTMIFGHTPTIRFQYEMPLRIWGGERVIGIDCGSGFEAGRLACLRLDDGKEFYSEE